jgi:hypothetical protein
MIRLLIAGVLLVLSHHQGVTAEPCWSKAEARKAWPRAHLYWSQASGKRCWSNRRGRKASIPVDTLTSPPPRPAPPSLPPAAVASLMPRHVETVAPPPSILDSPRWAWVARARDLNPGLGDMEFRLPSGTEVFSTFPGEQPEVWPPLERRARGAWGYGVAAILALLIAGAFWGGLSRMDRIRLENSTSGQRRTALWRGQKVSRYGGAA